MTDMGGYRFELSVHGRLVTPRHFDWQCIARAGSDLLWHNAVIDTAFARAWHRSQHDWRIQQLQAGNLKSGGASSPWQKSVVSDDEAGTRHRNSVEMLGAIAVG